MVGVSNVSGSLFSSVEADIETSVPTATSSVLIETISADVCHLTIHQQ